MSVDRSYISENKTQLARIQALLAGRSDAELARPMAAGWTIAGVLGHLAFWDQRALILLEHWEKGPRRRPRPRTPTDHDVPSIVLPPSKATEGQGGLFHSGVRVSCLRWDGRRRASATIWWPERRPRGRPSASTRSPPAWTISRIYDALQGS